MSDWIMDLSQAMEELANHKLRTLLTLLGMIFGVGAVIAMLSVGEGAEREALQLIDTMGLRNIIVKAKPAADDMLAEIREDSMGLNPRDLEAALETLPFLSGHTAVKGIRTFALYNDHGKSDASVQGVMQSHFALANLQLREGRPLAELDDRTFAQVCVIGSKVAADLFPGISPLEGLIKINHNWFRVVGVLEDRGTTRDEFEGVKLSGSRNVIFIPLHTALKKFKFKDMEDELDEIHVQVRTGIPTQVAAQTLSRLLETRHRGVDDYSLIVPEALLAQHRKTQRIFNIVMSAIAGISLLVGGIGIMNIMLASILERTREIGLRRAIGARAGDIMRLFMIESLAIAAIGGLIGIVLGFAMARTISVYSGWATAFSGFGVILSLGVCTGTGLIFGIYPAYKAAQLNPIEALRHD